MRVGVFVCAHALVFASYVCALHQTLFMAQMADNVPFGHRIPSSVILRVPSREFRDGGCQALARAKSPARDGETPVEKKAKEPHFGGCSFRGLALRAASTSGTNSH